MATRTLLTASLLALAACTRFAGLAPETVVTCAGSAGCPDGLVCNNGYCASPADVGNSPDLVGGAATVTDAAGTPLARVKAGGAFQVRLESTKPLKEPPVVTLGFDEPASPPCEPAGGNRWSCPYLATGQENGGKGGVAMIGVRLVDLGANVTNRSGAGSVELDFTPPSLVGPSVAPSQVPLGGTLQVFFTASEDLGKDPVLVASRALADGSGSATRFTLHPQAGTRNYVLTHVVTAADGVGPVTFTVELEDVVGNPAVGAVGTAGIDSVVPEITNLAVNARPIGKAGAATAGFTVSKAVATTQVSVGGRAMSCSVGAANAWTCTRTMQGNEIANGTAQDQAVLVDVADAAGNRALATGRVTFDFAPPTLPAPGLPAGALPLGGVLQLVLAPSEPLGANPVLEASQALDGGAGGQTRFTLTPQAGTGTYVFAHLVTSADPQGSTAFTLEMTDLAGNSATAAVGTVAIDRNPPTLSSLTVNATPVGKTGTATATFTVSKAVATPQATVGGRPMSCAAGASNAWTCSRAMLGNEIADGTAASQAVVVNVVDAAGNRDSQRQSVLFDFAPPSVASASVPPGPLPLGGSLQVVVTSSEALGTAPVLVASPGLIVGGVTTTQLPLAQQGGSLNYTLAAPHAVLAGDPQGTVSFTVQLTDLAGNSATRPVGTTSLDSVVPQLTHLGVASSDPSSGGTPLRLRAGLTLTASFDTSEPGQAPAVTVGGRAMSCGARQLGSPSYTCTRAVGADAAVPAGTEASQTVLVSFADPAGNATSASTTVVYDLKAPVISAGAASYVPSADNALAGIAGATLTAARSGTKVRVVVTSDEPLASAPLQSPSSQPLPFTAVAGSFTGTAVTLEATVAAQGDGTYSTTFVAADQAGNTATFTAGPANVRTSLPVLSVDQSQVTYLRSPWGNAAPESLGAFTVPAGPYFALAPADPLSNQATLPAGAFTIDRGSLKAVRVWSDAARTTLLGTVPRNVAGDWPRAQLASADLQTVWITALDEAGNESAPSRVSHAEWVATPNANVAGASPMALTSTSHVEPTLAQSVAVDAPGGPAAGTDTAAVRVASAPVWLGRTWLGNQPDARVRSAMAYDSQRGRVVLFGGTRSSTPLQDTWEWDGTDWTRMAVTMPGGARSGHAMAYDASRGRVVLFGGASSTTSYLGDTWEWDGVRWTQVAVGGGGPGLRAYHAMAYDSARRKVVLTGGEVPTGPSTKLTFQDTWEWDGVSWAQVASTMAGGARTHHAMAYDALRGQVVLYGGSAATDTWVWSGTAWSQAATAMSGGARSDHAMAYDVARGRVVLAGGSTGAADYQQDTWEWTGTAWVSAATALPGGARQGHAMAYDVARNCTVLFGGLFSSGSGPVYLQDLEEWNGSTWRFGARPAPSARGGPAMAYDGSRGRVVLVGGTDGTSWFQDTWEWDGTGWTQVAATLPGGARAWASLAYDSYRQRLVLFGGSSAAGGTTTYLQNTCEWTGAGWTQVASTMPGGARERSAMAYDSGGRRSVLFGGTNGTNLQDTWAWNGSAWSSVATTGPGGRYGHAMAYDAARGRVVLAGGTTGAAPAVFVDTWELAGSTWSQVTSFPGAGRQGHAMVYDGARQRVLMYGGQGYLTSMQETLEWDGSSWITTSALSPAGQRRFHGMAYDDARGRAVVFGGTTGVYDATTWELDEAASTRPAIGIALSIADSGLSLALPPTSVRIRAFTGGTYGTPASSGAVLLAWTRGSPAAGSSNVPGAWVPLAANSTGAAATAPYLPAAPASLLAWTTASPWSYVDPRTLTASFQLAPGGGAGRAIDGASVALDLLEVRVRYTVP